MDQRLMDYVSVDVEELSFFFWLLIPWGPLTTRVLNSFNTECFYQGFLGIEKSVM